MAKYSAEMDYLGPLRRYLRYAHRRLQSRLSLNAREISRVGGISGCDERPTILFPSEIAVALIFKPDRNFLRKWTTLRRCETAYYIPNEDFSRAYRNRPRKWPMRMRFEAT